MSQNHNSLYRVYRPTSFKDVAGHKNIVEILTTQLNQESFSHAFLFSGQRGTGKTSVARILAKAVNCLNLVAGDPCNQCVNCLAFNENQFVDVYEIDAASNNGVDEIRNIKSNISTLPIVGKYKVYIIDEVHMLTKGAFNALLKTLEEPPAHVIFILATTEYDKIPQTITSRCQNFNFKKINQVDLTSRLNFICEKEGYLLNRDVSEEIYNLSEGSLRDALNILEQLMILSLDKKITMQQLKKVFYVVTKVEKLSLLKFIFNQDASQVITYFEKAKNQGMDFDIFSLSLIKIIKEIVEYQLTKNERILSFLEVEEVNDFNVVKLEDLFLLADYLTQAYSKTKNQTISYDAIILSIIQSMQNFSQKTQFNLSTLNEETKIVESETKVQVEKMDEEIVLEEVEPKQSEIVQTEQKETVHWTQDLIQDLIKKDEVHEDLTNPMLAEENLINEPTIIENFISSKKPKLKEINDDELVTNLLGLIRKQNELVMQEAQRDEPIEFLVEELINVLRGAVIDQTILLRKDLMNKLNQLFSTNDQSDLLTPTEANEFIVFYNAKVVVANKNELILTADDDLGANLINHWLLDQTHRQAIFKLLGHEFAIYVVSEEIWNETKITHVNLKNKNMLPTYEKVNQENFYMNNQQKIAAMNSDENQEVFNRVADFFDPNDIKIG